MPTQTVRVLVAGAKDVVAAMSAMLKDLHAPAFEVATAASAVEALEALSQQPLEAALLDLGLPEALEWVRAAAPRVPVVALAASEAEGRRAIESGVQDFLLMGTFDAAGLQRAVRYAIENHGLRVELTLLDPLTGLYNRLGFQAVAEQYLRLARRLQHSLVLSVIDIDNLADLNRERGYSEGNRALLRVAGLLRSSFRESDLLARLGDDEFVFFALGASDRNAESMAARLTQALQDPEAAADEPHISLSAGIVWFDPESGVSLSDLLSQAQAASQAERQRKRGG